jgi:DNA/RNA endonuclease YhcR with UshA esterase domain
MLKLFDRSWLAIVMLLTVAALPVRTQASTPSIVISEIAWAGSSISSADEWIELTNVGDTAADLSGWTLTGAGSSGAVLTLPNGSLIEPQSTYVIANYEHTHANSALESAPQYVTASLSLPNGGFDLSLYDAGNTLIDVAGGAGAPFAGGSGGTGDSLGGRYTSMVRTDGLGDGSLQESWSDADMSSGYKTGVEDYGSPGIVAFASATTEPETNEESDAEELTEEVIPEEPIEETVVEEIAEEVLEVEDVNVVDEDEQSDPLVTSVPSDLSTTNIRISEFVVDPMEEAVEWIELYNAGDTLALDGWTIEDASGKATDLSGLAIDADSYLVIESPKGKLNNDTDTITLKDARGIIVESVVYGGDGYPAPKDGNSLAHNGEVFEITEQPTPGSANLIFVALENVEDVENTNTGVIPPGDQSLGGGGSEVSSEIKESQVDSETTKEVAILKTLRFVSLYPNTTGSDETEEYVEIQNVGDAPVDLLGWMIEDGSTDRFTMKDSLVIDAGDTVRLLRTQTKITLNNGGDTLELIAPDETVVDKMTYGNAAKGKMYEIVDGQWQWSGTVAGVVEAPAVESPIATSTSASTATPTVTSTTSSVNVSNSTNATYASSTNSSRVVQSVTVNEARIKTDGQRVSIKGIVTVVPGVFGSQIFYLADETGGIQIYLYNGDFPDLAFGDVIRIIGEMSTSRGERRVKLSGAADVVPASGSFERAVKNVSIEQVDASMVGSLITVEGHVQSKSSTKLVLEDSGVTLTIYLKSNPAIDPNQFERGDLLTITGVLTTYDGELRLRPRSLTDIQVTEEAVATTASLNESTNSGSSAGLILLFSTMAALAALAAWHYLPRRRLTPSAA